MITALENLLMGLERPPLCFECDAMNPSWASINNGIFICLNCAGAHRNLGPEISHIRSVRLDQWDEKMVKFLQRGGNKRLKDFFQAYEIQSFQIPQRYRTIGSIFYRERLRHEVEEQPFFKEISLETAKIVIEPSNVGGLLEKWKEKFTEGKELATQKFIEGKEYGEKIFEEGKEKFNEGKEYGGQWFEKGKNSMIGLLGVIEKGVEQVTGEPLKNEPKEKGKVEEDVEKKEGVSDEKREETKSKKN